MFLFLRSALDCGWYSQSHTPLEKKKKLFFPFQKLSIGKSILVSVHLLSFTLWFYLAWVNAGFAQAVNISTSSFVHKPCCVWRTLFPWDPYHHSISQFVCPLFAQIPKPRGKRDDEDIALRSGLSIVSYSPPVSDLKIFQGREMDHSVIKYFIFSFIVHYSFGMDLFSVVDLVYGFALGQLGFRWWFIPNIAVICLYSSV